MLHENIKKFMEGFQYDAHPMGIFLSTVGALSTFYPDAKTSSTRNSRLRQMHRLIAKMPSIAAYAYRHSIGRPYVYPDNDLSFTGNFLNMLFKMTELKYQPNPVLDAGARRAVHPARRPRAELQHERDADDRQLACRSVLGAGRRRRRAVRPAARRRQRGGAADAERDRLGATTCRSSSSGEGRRGRSRLMGFGHRVYKSYDPRAKIIKRIADQVFEVTGKNPLLDIALELERIALQDEYFVSAQALSERRLLLRPHLPGDGLPDGHVPGALRHPAHGRLARAVGGDAPRSEQKIARPRQIYTGPQQGTTSRRDKRT